MQQLPPLPLPSSIARAITMIVIHCSATASGRWLPGTGPAGVLTPAGVIDRWHAQRGFRRAASAVERFNAKLPSIGYHYVIDLDGHCWTGRHLAEVGAHVAGANAKSIGICLVGGAERDASYTPEQWEALAGLVTQLRQGIAGKGVPTPIGVCGHRDLSPDANGDGKVSANEWLKTCPGFDVPAWLGRDMRPLPQHVAPSRSNV